MLDDNLKRFIAENRRGVLTTFRRDGSAQMSIITCGPMQDGVAFTTTADRAKLKNLRRNARCSLLVARENWSAYVVLQGSARLLSADNTDADELRMALRGRLPHGLRHRASELGRIRCGYGGAAAVGNYCGARPCVWRQCFLGAVQSPIETCRQEQ